MDSLTYSLTIITVFLGMVFGVIVAFIAREELKDGRKYFILMQKIFITLIAVFALYFYELDKNVILLLSIILLLLLLKINLRYDFILYWLFGLALFLVSASQDIFRIVAILIFLYGFPAGTIFAEKFIEDKLMLAKKFLLYYGWFLLALILSGYV